MDATHLELGKPKLHRGWQGHNLLDLALGEAGVGLWQVASQRKDIENGGKNKKN